MDEIQKRIEPFAKDIKVFKTDRKAKKELGDIIYGNVMLVGAAISSGELPLDKDVVKSAVKSMAPRNVEENLKAFELGLEMGRE